MIIPFDNNLEVKITSPYGNRTLNGSKDWHNGYDMVGVGTRNVVAVADGTVIRSRIITDKSNLTWQWGNYICIKTKDNQYHYYCHLASRAVTEGQQVKAGEFIGVMGNTGYSFGAHLHFEVRKSDARTSICPEEVLDIPNKVGTYTQNSLDADLSVLQRAGVINTPEYWENIAPNTQYLPDLIHNMAEHIRKKG